MQGVFETNIGKLGTRKNSNFFFGWRGALVGVAGWGDHARWVTRGGLHEVSYVRWVSCEVSYVRWVSCEVGYARWVSHKVGLT